MSGLIKQLVEVKPGPSPTPREQIEMVEAAQDIIQEVRKSGCISQRDRAVRGQEEAHTCEWLPSGTGCCSVLPTMI